MKILIIILSGLLSWQGGAFAKSARTHRSVSTVKLNSANTKNWKKSLNSVVQKQGLETGDANACEKFDVQLAQDLRVNIVCGQFKKNIQVDLRKSEKRLVSHKDDHITITQFNYQVKKIQVNQMTQKSLNIPYVEEIIHLNIQSNGELAFHQQSFVVDQFGRIIQSQLIEAYGLTPADVSVTAQIQHKTKRR